MSEAPILLLGPEAEALAPRLEISGYRPLIGTETGLVPEAAVVSACCEGRLPEVRRRWGAIPVLLDISDDTVEARSHCLNSGADDFWLSSLGASDLLTRLRLHLHLSRQIRPPVDLLEVGPLKVNAGARSVRMGLRQVSLTAREYQLLLLLLQHRGEVVSRESILARIWSDDRAASSNVIEVYVRYLRQKLEEGGERRLIHTVRGQGYCLEDRSPGREALP